MSLIKNLAEAINTVQIMMGQAGWKKDLADKIKEFFKKPEAEKQSALNDINQTVEQKAPGEKAPEVAQNSEQLTPENDLVNQFYANNEQIKDSLKIDGKENDLDAYETSLNESAPQRMDILKQYNKQTGSKKTPEELEEFERDYRETQLDKREKELDQTKDSLEESQKLTDLQKTNPELAEKVENGEYLNVDEAQQANSASAAGTPETGTTGASTGGTTGTGTATTGAGTGEAAASSAQAGAEAAEAGSEAAEAAELLLLAL